MSARALCPETDPEAFFPETGGRSGPAKRVCEGCEIREPCLQIALHTPEREDFGVWGGTSERDRRKMRRDLGIITEHPCMECGAPCSGRRERCDPCRDARLVTQRVESAKRSSERRGAA